METFSKKINMDPLYLWTHLDNNNLSSICRVMCKNKTIILQKPLQLLCNDLFTQVFWSVFPCLLFNFLCWSLESDGGQSLTGISKRPGQTLIERLAFLYTGWSVSVKGMLLWAKKLATEQQGKLSEGKQTNTVWPLILGISPQEAHTESQRNCGKWDPAFLLH